MPLRISNRDARRLLLHVQGFTKKGLVDVVTHLGLVQLDTIQVVSRAHHHILWSRHERYREGMFDHLLERDRHVFESFTHDASILPMEMYPYWRRQFSRLAKDFGESSWGKGMASAAERETICERIAAEGPLCTKDFQGRADKSTHVWARPPHKLALDYMWAAGRLAVSHRRNFVKYYDLSERVIPVGVLEDEKSEEEQIDHLCRTALERLGFATAGEIQKFWEAMTRAEVKAWISSQDLEEVEVGTADGKTYQAFALPGMEERLDEASPSSSRLRILSPFDPLVRDRKRLEKIFGFEYRIEIFTPKAKRKYGYYVYPMLEGNRFIGRIEVKGDRKKGELIVENIWMEPGIQLSARRKEKLFSELRRMIRLIGVSEVIWNAS